MGRVTVDGTGATVADGAVAERNGARAGRGVARPGIRRLDRTTRTGTDEAANGERPIDEAAFADLYRAFKPRLARYASGLGSDDPEGVADLALFDFHRALGRGSFDSEPAVRAYLYRAVRSRVAGEFRKAVPMPVPYVEEEMERTATEDLSGPVVERELIVGLLDGLNDAQRQVIRARYMEDLTAEQVAKRTDRSTDAVYQLQRRGLDNLRRAVPTALLLLLFVACGIALLALTGQSSTVDTDPAENPPDVELDDRRSVGVEDESSNPVDGDGTTGGETGGAGDVIVLGTTIVGQTPADSGGSQAEDPPLLPDDGRFGVDDGSNPGQGPTSSAGGGPATSAQAGQGPTTTGATTTSSAPSTTVIIEPTTTVAPAPTTTVATTQATTAPSSTTTTLEPFPSQIDPRGTAMLRSDHSNLCLTAPGSAIGNGVVQRPCGDADIQTFEVVVRGQVNALRVVHSRLCLGPEGGRLVEGARIVQQECTGETGQVFSLPGGAFTFYDQDLCYAWENDSTSEGARLVLARCTEDANQSFRGA